MEAHSLCNLRYKRRIVKSGGMLYEKSEEVILLVMV